MINVLELYLDSIGYYIFIFIGISLLGIIPILKYQHLDLEEYHTRSMLGNIMHDKIFTSRASGTTIYL